MKTAFSLLLFMLAFHCINNRCMAQMGAIDASFGKNGYLFHNFGSNSDWGRNIVVQPDGNLIIAGQSDLNSTTDIALLRLTSTGIPDLSFGLNGSVLHDLQNSQDQTNAIILQPDGKIVVCGKSVFINNPIPTEDFLLHDLIRMARPMFHLTQLVLIL